MSKVQVILLLVIGFIVMMAIWNLVLSLKNMKLIEIDRKRKSGKEGEKMYSMEEFREIFKKAKEKILKKEADDFKKVGEENGNFDPIASAMFNLQNMLILSMLEKEIFDKED